MWPEHAGSPQDPETSGSPHPALPLNSRSKHLSRQSDMTSEPAGALRHDGRRGGPFPKISFCD